MKKIEIPTFLHPMKTLDSFVVCEKNKYLHALATAVIEDPGNIYNPLYIYGDVGRGKTHLLQAIAVGLKERNREMNIEYVEAEFFNSHSSDEKIDLMSTWQNADALIIDDVYLLDLEDNLQDLLQIAITTLVGLNRQVVLAGNCSLTELHLNYRVIQPFYSEYGFKICIRDVDRATKIKILQNLVRDSKMETNDEIDSVIQYIVNDSDGNIKAMKNKLNNVIGVSLLKNSPISLKRAKDLLNRNRLDG